MRRIDHRVRAREIKQEKKKKENDDKRARSVQAEDLKVAEEVWDEQRLRGKNLIFHQYFPNFMPILVHIS